MKILWDKQFKVESKHWFPFPFYIERWNDPKNKEMSLQTSLEKAKSAAIAGSSIFAIEMLKEIIRHHPTNVDAWLLLAEIIEEPEHAKSCLQRVLQLDPENVVARQKLARLRTHISDIDLFFDKEIISSSSNGGDYKPPGDHPDRANAAQQQSQAASRAVISPPEADRDKLLSPTPNQRKTASKKRRPVKKPSLGILQIVIIGVIVFLVLCVGILGLSALGSGGALAQQATPAPDENINVLYKNMRASNDNNIGRYKATIHPKSPTYQPTEDGIKTPFSDIFMLSYQISDVYVIDQHRNKALVHYKLTTRPSRGWTTFQDNRLTVEMVG